MKRFLVLLATLSLMLCAAPSQATFWGGGDTTNNTYNTDNSVTNKGGKGGDASATATVGDIENKNTNFNTNFNTNKTDVDVDVENKNTNLNTNINSNKNEQEQTQFQGQAQVQGQSQNTKQANKQETNIKFEAEEHKRNLPSAGSGRAFIAQGSDHYETASPTANFGTVDELVAIQKSFTLGQLMVLSGDNGDIDLDIRAFSSHRVALGNPAEGLEGMDMKTKITFVTSKPSGDAVGLFLGKGDTETDGMSVLAHVGIEAIRHGATTIYVTRNDFVKVLEGSSWGIMVGGGGSTIINDGGTNSSGVSIGPGIGYGAVRSAYGLEPSVRAYGFK